MGPEGFFVKERDWLLLARHRLMMRMLEWVDKPRTKASCDAAMAGNVQAGRHPMTGCDDWPVYFGVKVMAKKKGGGRRGC